MEAAPGSLVPELTNFYIIVSESVQKAIYLLLSQIPLQS